MQLIETQRGEVVLRYLDRNFYAGDMLPSGQPVAELEGLDSVLRERWLNQKRQKSSGRQPTGHEKIGLGVRVSKEAKAILRRLSDRTGESMSAIAGKLVESEAARMDQEAFDA